MGRVGCARECMISRLFLCLAGLREQTLQALSEVTAEILRSHDIRFHCLGCATSQA